MDHIMEIDGQNLDRLIVAAKGCKRWVENSRPDAADECLAAFALELLEPQKELLAQPNNSRYCEAVVNILFPEYGLDIPWVVRYENVKMYRRLILLGFRPFIAPGSDNSIATPLLASYDKWLRGEWTPIVSAYRENGIAVDFRRRPDLGSILMQMDNLMIA